MRTATAPRDLSGAAIRSFENVANRWKLSNGERMALLGQLAPSTYYRLRGKPDGAELKGDTLERVSHVLGVYKALHVLFPSAEFADQWISVPNAAFGGHPAKEKMLSGFSGLIDVRRYLDAQRGQ